jgi:hypothetical protein
MTIAAGFLHEKGLLMCADTLLTSGVVSTHEAKLIGVGFHDGAVIFAYAGHADMAEAAIQQCELALRDTSATMRSRAALAATIRVILAREYKTHIVDNRYENTDHDYALLVGIYSDVDGLGLYCSSRTQLKKSKTGVEFIGEGAGVSILTLRGLHQDAPPLRTRYFQSRSAIELAVYALSKAKLHLQGSCGGELLLAVLHSDGTVGGIMDNDVDSIAKYSQRFDNEAARLLLTFLGRDDKIFEELLENFVDVIRQEREQYKLRKPTGPLWRVANLSDLLTEINFRHEPDLQPGR